MVTTIKAIETVYNGYRFRSRIEARWAVALDAAKVPYVYEPDTYSLPPSKPEPGIDLGDRAPFAGKTLYYLPDFWLPMSEQFLEVKGAEPTPVEQEKAWRLARLTGYGVVIVYGDLPYPHPDYGGNNESGWLDGGADTMYWLCECPKCGKVGFEYQGRAERLCKCYPDRDAGGGFNSPRLVRAYLAGRQARFEHGESGAPRPMVQQRTSVPVRPTPPPRPKDVLSRPGYQPSQTAIARQATKGLTDVTLPITIFALHGDAYSLTVHLQASNGLPWCVRGASLKNGNSYGGFIVQKGTRILRDYTLLVSRFPNPKQPANLCGRCAAGWPIQLQVQAPAPALEDEEEDMDPLDEAIATYFPSAEPAAVREAAELCFGRELELFDLENAEACAWCGLPMFDNDFARLGDNEADPDMQHVCMACLEGAAEPVASLTH